MAYKNYQDGLIIENIHIADDIYRITLRGNFQGEPGQFFMIKSWDLDPLLPRPLSIHDMKEDQISFLYQVVGKGTGILSKIKEGETIKVLGPLGRGFPIEGKKIALVAGGIGLAPLMYLARTLKEKGKKFDLYVGFRSIPYLMKEFGEFCEDTKITTNDGRIGHKGFVTEIIPDDYDTVFACGPNVMMNSLKKLELSATEYYSLEAHMACGIGACLGCSIKTPSGMKRVCHEGPVFEKDEVIFDA